MILIRLQKCKHWRKWVWSRRKIVCKGNPFPSHNLCCFCNDPVWMDVYPIWSPAIFANKCCSCTLEMRLHVIVSFVTNGKHLQCSAVAIPFLVVEILIVCLGSPSGHLMVSASVGYLLVMYAFEHPRMRLLINFIVVVSLTCSLIFLHILPRLIF